MEFDQIAIYTEDIERSIAELADLGYDKWVRDTVTADAKLPGLFEGVFQAQLAFNYQILNGSELELIQPLTEPNHVKCNHHEVAHFGIHVNGAPSPLFNLKRTLLQECQTTGHTNPGVGSRRYHYSIYDLAGFPFPVKLIRRINV